MFPGLNARGRRVNMAPKTRQADVETGEITEAGLRELDGRIGEYRHKAGATIRVMSMAQDMFGYLPEEVMRRIADGLGIPRVEVFGIATFYSHFLLTPPARHTIVSCQGTACYVNGGREVLEEIQRILKIGPGETTPDCEFSIQVVRCIGACALSPVICVDSKVYSRVSPRRVKKILATHSSGYGGESHE